MLADVTTLLTSPDRFFEQRGADPSVKGPLLTVAAVALVGVIGGIAASVVQVSRLPSDAAGFVAIGAVFGLLLAAVMPVVVWLVYSGLFLGLTALLGGEGEPRDTILLTGWGMAPRVLGALAVAAASIAATLLVPAPSGIESMQAYSQQVGQHPLNVAASAIQLFTFLWSGYLWVSAVQVARNVDRRNAAIAVGVPLLLEVVVTLGLIAFTLLGSAMSP